MRSFRRRVAAITAATGLVLAGCSESAEPEANQVDHVRLYGTDGTMQNSFAAELADRTVLHGMKGTAPMSELPAEFTDRLRELNSSLTDSLFAGETYDAVVISALAAELAGTSDPAEIRKYVNSVTTGGEQCTVVADCLELASEGEQLEYRGMSLQGGGFTELGEPAVASYAIQHFGEDGVLDEDKTEFVGAGDPATTTTDAESPEPGSGSNGPGQEEPLKLGGLLPETGDLSFAYPPMIAAVQLALDDINEAGGVLGADVEWVDGDDGTNPEVARETIESHLEEGVHVFIGAAASGVTEAVMADVTGAGRILFSPSNTAAELTAADHDGYYFRTAPSDVLQGAALADIVLRDGVSRVAIVARDDAYGLGLQGNTNDSLLRLGVPSSDIALLSYPTPEAEGGPVAGLDDLVTDIIAAEPDGVVVIGFSEAAQLIQRMIDEGLQVQP